MKKTIGAMYMGEYFASIPVKEFPGMSGTRRQGIIDKLCPMMPDDRKLFWYNLPVNYNE